MVVFLVDTNFAGLSVQCHCKLHGLVNLSNASLCRSVEVILYFGVPFPLQDLFFLVDITRQVIVDFVWLCFMLPVLVIACLKLLFYGGGVAGVSTSHFIPVLGDNVP